MLYSANEFLRSGKADTAGSQICQLRHDNNIYPNSVVNTHTNFLLQLWPVVLAVVVVLCTSIICVYNLSGWFDRFCFLLSWTKVGLFSDHSHDKVITYRNHIQNCKNTTCHMYFRVLCVPCRKYNHQAKSFHWGFYVVCSPKHKPDLHFLRADAWLLGRFLFPHFYFTDSTVGSTHTYVLTSRMAFKWCLTLISDSIHNLGSNYWTSRCTHTRTHTLRHICKHASSHTHRLKSNDWYLCSGVLT